MSKQSQTTGVQSPTKEVSLDDMYLASSELLHKKLARLSNCKTRTISLITYRKIIKEYFRLVFEEAITTGKRVSLFRYFGYFYCAKTLCTRYNPRSFYFVTENGIKKRIERKIDINKTGGFFYFMFWDSPLKYRGYKLSLTIKWKKLIFNKGVSQDIYRDITNTSNRTEKINTWHKKKKGYMKSESLSLQ
jgi:hypothetical protein